MKSNNFDNFFACSKRAPVEDGTRRMFSTSEEDGMMVSTSEKDGRIISTSE